MRSINNITLSCSTGHLRLRICGHVPDPIDPNRDTQLEDYGVLAGETSKQVEALCTANGEEIDDIMYAEIIK